MKKLHRIFAALLMLCLLVQMIPATAQEAVSWSLVAGVLTISGSGPMADYAAAADAPWYDHREEITKVIVSEGITSVGSNSFTWYSNLVQVIFPEGLLSIGKNAFWGCESLRSVELPASLERIETCAFFRSGLTAVSIPVGVTELEQGVFGQCQNLRSVVLHDGITVIRKDAFSRCYVLKEITLPAGLESVGEHAFFACVLLKKLEFGAGLTQIGSAAFYGCSSLNQLVFTGNAPALAADAFLGISASVAYPSNGAGWDTVAGGSYGGEITWISGCQHQYATSVFTEPTCLQQGFCTFTCNLCGHSYEGLFVDPLGHSFSNYMSDGNATMDADGTKSAVCDRGCGAVDTIVDEGSRLPPTITSDVYAIGDEIVRCIPLKTTVQTFLENMQQDGLRVTKDGEVLGADQWVGTGMVVQLLSGEQVVAGWILVVTGDVNGDGDATVTDMLMVKSHLLKKSTLEGVQAQGADTNGDKTISVTDFIQIKAHILGKEKIKPN